jgi:hypothetical protein
MEQKRTRPRRIEWKCIVLNKAVGLGCDKHVDYGSLFDLLKL